MLTGERFDEEILKPKNVKKRAVKGAGRQLESYAREDEIKKN